MSKTDRNEALRLADALRAERRRRIMQDTDWWIMLEAFALSLVGISAIGVFLLLHNGHLPL